MSLEEPVRQPQTPCVQLKSLRARIEGPDYYMQRIQPEASELQGLGVQNVSKEDDTADTAGDSCTAVASTRPPSKTVRQPRPLQQQQQIASELAAQRVPLRIQVIQVSPPMFQICSERFHISVVIL